MFHALLDSKGFIYVHQPVSSLYIYSTAICSHISWCLRHSRLSQTRIKAVHFGHCRNYMSSMDIVIVYTQRQLDTQNHNKQLAAQILDINCLCLGR